MNPQEANSDFPGNIRLLVIADTDTNTKKRRLL